MISSLNQTALFSAIQWRDVEKVLPLPGDVVQYIAERDNGAHLMIGVMVNDCAGNRDNLYYGSVAARSVYWTEAPETPISVARHSSDY